MSTFNTQYYTDMIQQAAYQTAPDVKPPKKKRDPNDPGDPLLEKALKPNPESLGNVFNAMVADPLASNAFDQFKEFYEEVGMAKVMVMTPTRVSEVSIYHMAAVLAGSGTMRTLLLPDPARFYREIETAVNSLRELQKTDARVRAFSRHISQQLVAA